jgi:putative solute:sodium symporter small subunit
MQDDGVQVEVLTRGPDRAQSARDRYWRSSVGWTVLGLLGWLAVTFAAAWFAGAFNRWTVAGAPAGYWLAAQGAIGAYLLIIVAYGWVMDGLDERCQRAVDEAPEEAVPAASSTAAPDDRRDRTHG